MPIATSLDRFTTCSVSGHYEYGFLDPGWPCSLEGIAVPCKQSSSPCDTAQRLSGSTAETHTAFLVVKYRWVWPRRNVHHFLGLWNIPAHPQPKHHTSRWQCQGGPLRLHSVRELPNSLDRKQTLWRLPDNNKVRIIMKSYFRPTSGVGDHTCHQEWEGTACMYQPWSPPAGSRGYA
jgi:hypothetical protein